MIDRDAMLCQVYGMATMSDRALDQTTQMAR